MWQVPSFLWSLAVFLFRQRNRYDVVHAHGTLQHVTASLVARLLGKKSLLKVAMADSDIDFGRQGRHVGTHQSLPGEPVRSYIATSRIIRKEFASHGFAPGRVYAIPNGVDTEIYRPARRRQEKSRAARRLELADKPTAVFVGIIISAQERRFRVARVARSATAAASTRQLVHRRPAARTQRRGRRRYLRTAAEVHER